MARIGIGAIGCGGMGRSTLGKVVQHSPDLKVEGLCDPDHSSITKTVEVLGYEPRVYGDFRDLVASPDIHWVMIASWNSAHCDQVLAAFEAGKHVFCQKPLALSVEDCRRMRDAWLASGRMFNIGFTLRYSPHYRKIKQLLSDNAIGRIVSMEFNETLDFNHGGWIMGDWRRLRANSGTHLLEKCCHDIDLVNWMTCSVPRRVASFAGLDFFLPGNEYHVTRIGKNAKGQDAYMTAGVLNPFKADKDIVDNQVAILEYRNGVRAMFHTNCNAGIPERRMYILGTEGALRADVLTGTIQIKRIGFDTQMQDASTSGKGGHGGGDAVLAAELAASMLEGRQPSAGLDDGVRASLACFAIDEAADTGRVVDLDPYWKAMGIAPPD